MRLIELHDINNPSRVVVMDAEDFSTAQPYFNGSAIRLKSSDAQFLVAETPEQVEKTLQ